MQQQSDFYNYLPDNCQREGFYHSNKFASQIDAFDSQPQNLDQAESSSSSNHATQTTALKGGTDFRRRKNWSERILVEITGLLHVLSPVGKILYCSESTHELTGYRPHELVGQPLMDFLHVDDMDVFIRDFQMAFHTRSQIKTHYRFRKKDDTYVIFEVVGHPKSDMPGQPPQTFFGIAQPVPTKSGALIDAFLELKAENNWLKKRINELSAKYGKAEMKEAVEDVHIIHEEENNQDWAEKRNSSSDLDDFMTSYKEEQEPSEVRKGRWKRRKHKGADEYVCADCGTTSSPEWRRGKHGPKTLCNACGLRWSKEMKKKDSHSNTQGPSVA